MKPKLSKQIYIRDRSQEGIASLLLVVVLTMVLVTLSIAIARSSLVRFKSIEHVKNARNAYYLAETGVEDTMIQLEENISYSGNPTGEITEVGTYYSTINSLNQVYDITAWTDEKYIYRKVNLNVTLGYDYAPVTTKATYMSDTFSIHGENSRIQGDVWTNDDFVIEEEALVEGNLSAAGKGSHAVNWVWDGVTGGDITLDGGILTDNPETADIVEGNILAFDDVRVSGSGSLVTGDIISNGIVEVINGGQVDGTITENATTDWQDIPVPTFSFDEYKEQAILDGNYYKNQNEFEGFLESIDDGIERRLPDGVYYVKSGAVKIYPGSPVYLNGTLVVEDNLYIYCEWHQNVANDLPVIAAGKDLKIHSYVDEVSGDYEETGPVNIVGIVYAAKRIDLYRKNPSENIYIDGAVWAGDDIFIEDNTFIKYNSDVASNVLGFDFVNGISDLQINSWLEIY